VPSANLGAGGYGFGGKTGLGLTCALAIDASATMTTATVPAMWAMREEITSIAPCEVVEEFYARAAAERKSIVADEDFSDLAV
jgi:hypothetical protein